MGGVHKGFRDLLELGWLDHMPRLFGIQAEGSSYLTEAWQNGEDVVSKPAIAAETIADSISAGLPRDRIKAMNAITQTDGAFVSVSDAEILAAVPAFARASGIFAEPAGAAAYAGLIAALDRKLVSPSDRIVLINTGNGLKDVQGAMNALEQTGTKAHTVAASFDAVAEIFEK